MCISSQDLKFQTKLLKTSYNLVDSPGEDHYFVYNVYMKGTNGKYL